MPHIESMNPNVLYEDDSMLVIDKPAGLMVHSDGKSTDPTLIDWLLKKYPSIEDVGEPMRLQSGVVLHRPGIVHRLDRETSGVMVVAKTAEAFDFLKRQFQDRSIEKTYLAFLYDSLPEKRGVIDRPIGRSRGDFRKWSAQRGARGMMRDAETHYKVLREGEGCSYVEASPKTGRTHQLRVHFKAIHHPVLCDKVYAPGKPCLLGFERLALHARTLSFQLLEGKRAAFEAPLPADFERALERLSSKKP